MGSEKDEIAAVETAEANIRADRRSGEISKEQFEKEMLIAAKYRAQVEAESVARKRQRRE